MKIRVSVKGDRIASQIIQYWVECSQQLSTDEKKHIENLTETELLEYAKMQGLSVTKLG